jgi:hypothetical protein
MQRLSAFVLIILLFSACVKTKFNDKNGSTSLTGTLPRSVTCCGVNVGTSNSPKIWGANGHPNNQVQYFGNVDAQLDLLQEMGMTQYRVDLGAQRTGELTGGNLTRFNELMTKCQQRGITVLPVLINNEWWASNYTRDDAYYVGHMLGYGFVSRYGSYFHTYEIGNEEDLYCLPGNPSGANTSDYDAVKFEKTYYFFNGMIEGIKAVDPAAKLIINCAGWYHYGFFTLLNQHNVQYDILGYHWYDDKPADFFLVLNQLATFNKDVWFTELNSRADTLVETFQKTSDFVYNYLNALENRSFVKAVFVYELFNEDGQTRGEQFYGLTYWNTPFNFTAYTKKPAVANWKYEIEENLHGNEDFVYSFFLYCDNRVPDQGGLQYWTNRLTSTGDRQEVITVGMSQEGNGRFVEEQYNALLDDATISTDTWNYWLGRMQNGTIREQVICELCASAEFYTKSGSTAGGYIERLFNRLLGRPSDPTGKAYWVNVLNSNGDRYGVASQFIHGVEYYNRFVDAQFHKLLRRTGPTEQSAIDYYAGKLAGGSTQFDVINMLLMSDEYWYRGINEGYLRRHPGYPLN